MEFLSLAMAMTAGANLSSKPVMSDAESIIKMLSHRKEELRNTHKTHHSLLTAIDLLITAGSPLPQHIRSHPEKHKPDRNSWTGDDWGNYIADRAAGNDLNTLRRGGLDIRDITVQSTDALSHLLTPGHWYLSDITGTSISTIGLRELMQQFHFKQYITTRDGYRKDRGASIKWAYNTIEFATQTFNLQHRTTAQRAVEVRRLWDKGWHGGNRAKDPRLIPGSIEHTSALSCDLCSLPDSADHWMHTCQHSASTAVRTAALQELQLIVAGTTPSQLHRLATAFETLLLTTDEPARMWTGNFNTVQCSILTAALPGLLSDTAYTDIKTLFHNLLRPLHTAAAILWFNKLGAQTPTDINTIPTRPTPTANDVIDMFNPLTTLFPTPQPRPKKGRPRKPLPSQALTAHKRPLIAPTLPPPLTRLIGPVQPPRRLVLPRPDIADVHNLNQALLSNPANTVLLNIDNLAVTCSSYYTILPKTWLDDQIIHAYLALLQQRNPKTMYVSLNTTQFNFPPHQRSINHNFINLLCPNIPITQRDLIFIPINITNTHWTLVAIDRRRKRISYYDSLRGDGTLYLQNAVAYLKAQEDALHTALPQLHPPFDIAEWTLHPNAGFDFPAQPNSYDCGIYVLMVADVLASNLPVSLLTITAMAHARTHVGMGLWLQRPPDLLHHAPFHYTPCPAPPRRPTTQTTIAINNNNNEILNA
jgi:hypothetical protein